MSSSLKPEVRPFSSLESYEQEEPGIASFHWVLKENEIPQTCIGHVSLEGPIHKTPGVHEEFDQVYVVLSGTGTVHLEDRSIKITEPSAIIIPSNTKHSMELRAGEKIQYVFFNKSI